MTSALLTLTQPLIVTQTLNLLTLTVIVVLRFVPCPNLNQATWTNSVPIGNTDTSNGYYVTNDVTVGEDRFVYIRSAFFVRIKCLWFSQNACIFKVHYTGEGLCPLPIFHPLFFQIFTVKQVNFWCRRLVVAACTKDLKEAQQQQQHQN